MFKKITVYCSSSKSLAVDYYEETKKIGHLLADANVTIIYGGGAGGLMGTLADAALERNGNVVGVIPHFMKEVEWNHKGVQEMIFVEDMAERKKILIEGTDAVLALPGGCGTFEELFEVMSAKRLGLFVKPIVIYNYKGYYDPLLKMLDRTIEENFMNEAHRELWSVIDKPEQLIPKILETPNWSADAIRFAIS